MRLKDNVLAVLRIIARYIHGLILALCEACHSEMLDTGEVAAAEYLGTFAARKEDQILNV